MKKKTIKKMKMCRQWSSAHNRACSAVIGQYRVQWRRSPPLAGRLVPAPVHWSAVNAASPAPPAPPCVCTPSAAAPPHSAPSPSPAPPPPPAPPAAASETPPAGERVTGGGKAFCRKCRCTGQEVWNTLMHTHTLTHTHTHTHREQHKWPWIRSL